MSEADLQAIAENTRQLKLLQETPDSPEALATIPILKIADLDRRNKLIPLDVENLSGCKVLYHDLFTNGILYLDIGFDIKRLPEEIVPFVPLFGRALLEMGTDEEDYVKLSRRIGKTTGGIDSTTFISTVQGTDNSTSWLFLRAKVTPEHEDDLLEILSDIFSTAHLDDKERFRQIVLEEKASMEARLVPMGNWFVDTRLRAHQNEAGWVTEQTGGISYLFFLRELESGIDKDWTGVLAKLEMVRSLFISRKAMIANVTWDADNWNRLRPKLSGFLNSMSSSDLPETQWKPQLISGNEGLTITAQVNYVGKGTNIYDLGYELAGSVWVILNHLRTTWLWERVRVRGGAYGGSCVFDHRSGIFNFLSYRDPNLLQTLDVYDGTGQFLRELKISQEELTKNIIGAIGIMDAYQLPDAKGYTSLQRYLSGESDEGRQRLRDQVLSTKPEDFKMFGEFLEKVRSNSDVAVMGSEEAISSATTSNPEWLKITKVL